MHTLKITVISFCFLLLNNVLDAQSVSNGWKLVAENKREEAIKEFENVLKKGSDSENALVALALLESFEQKEDIAQTRILTLARTAPNPNPYLYAFWNHELGIAYDGLNKVQLQVMELVLQDARFNATLKAMANYTLGGYYDGLGKYKEAKKYYDALGAITTWQIAGEFDNISASGFDKNYEPIFKPEGNAEFTNKNEAKVAWITPIQSRADQYFDFKYHFSPSNSVFYAQTFIEIPNDAEVFVRTGASGSLKIWINDALVTSIEEERNTDLDVNIQRVSLKKGFNRVLLQIGVSEKERANFICRITDKDGTLIPGLNVRNTYQPYPKSQSAAALPHSTIAEEAFFEALKDDDTYKLRNILLLGSIYNRNEKKDAAKTLLQKASKEYPDCSILRARLLETYLRLSDNTEYSVEKQKIMELDPTTQLGFEFKIGEAYDNENLEETEKLLASYKNIYGENNFYDKQLLGLRAKQSKYDELVQLVEKGYKKYPDDYAFVKIKASIDREAYKNIKGAIKTVKTFYDQHLGSDVVEDLAALYRANNQIDKALELYADLLLQKPYLTGYYSSIGDHYFGIRNYAEAIKWYDKAIAQAPFYSSFWESKGEALMEKGDEAAAKEAFVKCLYYNPLNYDVRKKLRVLNKQKEIYTYFDDTDIYKKIKDAPKAAEYPNDNSLVAYYEVEKIVYPEGGFEARTIMAVKILKDAGVDAWKEYSISYNNYTEHLIIEKAEIVKPNGNKIEAETDGGYIVFKGLEADDAIYINYRLEDYSRGKLFKHFWDRFQFNYGVPVVNISYHLLVPKEKKFKYSTENIALEPEKKDMGEFYRYSWKKDQSPAIRDENFMPAYTDISEALHLSSVPDWDYISKWYADLALQKTQTDPTVKETVKGLMKGKEGASEREKAEIIYNFIIQNIKYSSVSFRQGRFIPQKAYRTLSTKLGDCKDVATLYVTMAKEAGLKAKLVLINTHDNGNKAMILPSNEFNHCIAQVTADNKDYYLELTANYLPFGTATYGLKKAASLIISPDENIKSDLKPLVFDNCPLNAVIRTSNISFNDKDMIVARKNVRYGVYAFSNRDNYISLNAEEREKKISNDINDDYKTSVKLNRLEFAQLESSADSVSAQFEFRVKNHLSSVGSIKVMAIPWADAENIGNLSSEEKRSYPIYNYDFADYVKETMVIEIPSGKSLLEMPKDQRFLLKNMSYETTYTLVGNKLTATRTTRFNEESLPATDLVVFQEFMNKILEADALQIGFK